MTWKTLFSEARRRALYEARLPEAVIDILRDHVEQSGDLDDAISDFESYGDREMFLPGRVKAKASDMAAELRRWKPKPHPGNTTVYHATSPQTAAFMLKNGVIPQMKPWTLAARRFAAGEHAEFQPGAGVERGIYVGSTPHVVSGFGHVILAMKVPKAWVKVPAELKVLGHHPNDVEGAMETEHGGLVKEPIHPHAIKRHH